MVSQEEFAGLFIDIRDLLKKIYEEEHAQTQVLIQIRGLLNQQATHIQPVESSRPPKFKR